MKECDTKIEQIERMFRVPDRVADKVQCEAEKVHGGYVLIETRPPWDGSPGPWTRSPIAKFFCHRPSQTWKLYWMRASGKWWMYETYKTFGGALRAVKQDRHGCFWG